ncbi:hypothetical protein VTJ49DRAFT_501 [Mycothermus thermophilus]|uniref:GRF-like zinc ribbon domain-containing protein n=1 Tax=Humicola insolens TaxID=85995 RepID=A0ABR3VFE6_HUMIN
MAPTPTPDSTVNGAPFAELSMRLQAFADIFRRIGDTLSSLSIVMNQNMGLVEETLRSLAVAVDMASAQAPPASTNLPNTQKDVESSGTTQDSLAEPANDTSQRAHPAPGSTRSAPSPEQDGDDPLLTSEARRIDKGKGVVVVSADSTTQAEQSASGSLGLAQSASGSRQTIRTSSNEQVDSGSAPRNSFSGPGPAGSLNNLPFTFSRFSPSHARRLPAQSAGTAVQTDTVGQRDGSNAVLAPVQAGSADQGNPASTTAPAPRPTQAIPDNHQDIYDLSNSLTQLSIATGAPHEGEEVSDAESALEEEQEPPHTPVANAPHAGRLWHSTRQCFLCNQPVWPNTATPNNATGNGGRPYYKCGPCDNFLGFGDRRGLDPNNPPCDCGSPSRRQISRSGATIPYGIHFVCALPTETDSCDFFQWGDVEVDGRRLAAVLDAAVRRRLIDEERV